MASLRHPCKFQRVSRLGTVTARHSSIGRQPNFAALNRGCHLYSAGRPSRWALAHISSCQVTLATCYHYDYTQNHRTTLTTSHLSQVWLDECLCTKSMTNAHSEMVQNAFAAVARLLSRRSQVFLQRSGNTRKDCLSCIHRTQFH